MHHKQPIQSMTGYGESNYESPDIYVRVIIRSVNSRYLDIDSHLPRLFSRQELQWRKHFARQLKRGRIYFALTYQYRALNTADVLNEGLLKKYTSFLKDLCTSIGIQPQVLTGALGLPGVVQTEPLKSLPENVQAIVTKTVFKALEECVASRLQEGSHLVKQLETYLHTLEELLKKLDDHVVQQQTLLQAQLQERLTKQLITPQELEIERSTNLQKTSVEEEKIRLKSHLSFFQKSLRQGGSLGKKLTFITQELSRELNTIGAKSQYGPLQHLIVHMKELVEQMREQIANLV